MAATVLNVPYILSAVVAITKMTDFPIGIIILLKLCFVVAAFEHIHGSSSDHQHQHQHQHEHQHQHQVYFVPTLKDAANIGDLLFAQAHFTYGSNGNSKNETKVKLDSHDLLLGKSRQTFSWMESISPEYEGALKQIALYSNLHRTMLYVDDKLTLKPEENLLRWTEEVLSESEKGLIWSLALMNQLVQGHSTEQSLSIVKIFKRNAKPIKESSVCSQIHKYRDYLTGVQLQGYALLSGALNQVGHHQAVHALLDLAMQRFKEQENIIGARYNDWYEYGQGSCSNRIQMLSDQARCIKLQHMKFDISPPIIVGNCTTVEPLPEEQWIYNKVSWQITPKWNRSFCLQKHLDGYNNGIPIVLRKCQSHQSQYYNEKWVIDSQSGQVKLFADPYKCLTLRNGGLVIWKCTDSDCLKCKDRWGDGHFNLHQKLNAALKSPYGDLQLVTWMGLEI